MEASETIHCPYCGQSFELAIDTSAASQRLTTDCEVCCRPFEVCLLNVNRVKFWTWKCMEREDIRN